MQELLLTLNFGNRLRSESRGLMVLLLSRRANLYTHAAHVATAP